MIDFRYHAMSLAAVFVALTVGLLLGATIGDTELLSNVRGNLEQSLKTDLNQASQRNKDLEQQRERQDDFVQVAYPQMVKSRLRGARVALIGSAGATRDVLKPLSGAIEPAGADLTYAAELVRKPRYAALAAALDVPDVPAAGATAGQTERLGRAVGRRLSRGHERLVMRRFVFSKLSGNIKRVRLFAFARSAPAERAGDDAELLDAFQVGIVAGLAQEARRVVGVETLSVDPSNVKWYNDLGLSTIDNIELYPGHYALVLLLAGAKGDYGYKKTADAVIPPVAP